MKRTEATNIHLAGQGGAINRRADLRITVDLRADKKLEAVSKGTSTEHNLFANGSGPSYNADDNTKWTTRWKGTWTTSGDKLTLDLVLVDHKCSHTKTTDHNQPEVVPCEVASNRAQLVCTSEQIKLEDLSQPDKAQQVDAWRCNTKTSTELAESPSPWLFGRTMCIETIGGPPFGEQFRRCTP